MANLYGIAAINIIRNIEDAEEQEERQYFIPDDPYDLSDYIYTDMLQPYLPVQQRVQGLSNQRKILEALRFFASGSYQLDIARNQMVTVSQPSVSRAMHNVIDAMNQQRILNRYIHFPSTTEELRNARQKFFDKYGLPGIIGCIDCTHIAIASPVENEHMYVNRKGFHSLNVQLICDESLRITNMNARYPGSTHDRFIWRNSNIERFLSSLTENEVGSLYLLGDSGYPLRPWLITPILPEPDEGTAESRFNNRIRQIRVLIEQCHGPLRNRFRCILKHRVLHYAPTTAAKIANSCAVLHNLCIENNVPLHNDENINANSIDDIENIINQVDNQQGQDNNLVNRGRHTRQLLIQNYFNN